MTRSMMRTTVAAAAAASLAIGISGCSTTVDETDESSNTGLDSQGLEFSDDATPPGDGAIDASPVTDTTAGTAAELLTAIGVDMSRLSAQIAGEGDEDTTFARIEERWFAVRDEVEATRPELVNGISTSVDMARTAVVANRPADADKAFSILTDLIDAFVDDA